MKKFQNSISVAMLSMVSGLACAQDRQPIFNVDYEGPSGTNTLMSIDFGGGLVFNKFIHATQASNFYMEGSSGATRIVRAPDSDVGPEPMKAPTASSSDSDKLEFETRLTEVFQNTNLNSFIDNQGSSPYFSFVLELEKPVKDDEAGDDDSVGEIIFFERGRNVANSYILLEALDEDGNVIGTPYLLDPDTPIEMSPSVQAAVFRGNLSYAGWSQDLGGVSIDLGKLGVSSLTRLRVSRPTVGENGMESGMLTGGRDLNPDFKLVFVQTYNVMLPAWMIGD